MARRNNLICADHGQRTLVDRTMIIHQFVGTLCDSNMFYNSEKLYNRKALKDKVKKHEYL